MFLAGLELELDELLKSGKVAALAGTLGVILPLLGGYATALLFGLSQTEAVFIGLALSATSVSISARTLMELGVLRSKVGICLLYTSVPAKEKPIPLFSCQKPTQRPRRSHREHRGA